jgi:hypothetical protein
VDAQPGGALRSADLSHALVHRAGVPDKATRLPVRVGTGSDHLPAIDLDV